MSDDLPSFPTRQLPPLPSTLPQRNIFLSHATYAGLSFSLQQLSIVEDHDKCLTLPPYLSSKRVQRRDLKDHPVVTMSPTAHQFKFFPHTQIAVPPRPFATPTDQAFLEQNPPKYAKRAYSCAFTPGRVPLLVTKRPRHHPREKPTRLRTGKPVKTGIHEDIWNLILRQTDPRTLLNLRATCRSFYQMLDKPSLWKECRQNMLRYTPPPPDGLHERQYVQLLEGSGCMSCGVKKTRKVQWAFLCRLCDKCFRSKTMTVRQSVFVYAKFTDMLRRLLRLKRLT